MEIQARDVLLVVRELLEMVLDILEVFFYPIGLRPHAAGPPSLSFGVGGLEGFVLFESTLVLSRKSLFLSRRS